jgi:hypothetical protein
VTTSNLNFTARMCLEQDVPALRMFLSTHWKSDHVFVKDPGVFDWQHPVDRSGRVSFAIAEDRSTREIVGALGYVPLERFDAELACHRHFWLALWKVSDPKRYQGAGVALLNFVRKHTGASFLGAMGLTEEVVPLYRALRFSVGRTTQWILDRESTAAASSVHSQVVEWAQWNQSHPHPRGEIPKLWTPFKSLAFFRNRFVENPFYAYDVLVSVQHGEPRAVLASRICEGNGVRVARIVDFYGDWDSLPSLAAHVKARAETRGALYTDLVSWRGDEETLRKAGFVPRQVSSHPNAPHRFEPFDPAPRELLCAFEGSQDDRVCFFKADADQDRPALSGLRRSHLVVHVS